MTKIWTDEKITEVANQYKTIKDWRKNHYKSYTAAKKQKRIKEFTGHMIELVKPVRYWNKDRIIECVKKCTTLSEFKEQYPSAYGSSNKLGIYQEVTKHLVRKIKPMDYWNKDRVLCSAKKYTKRLDWKTNESAAYSAAYDLGIYEQATKHMPRIGSQKLRAVYCYYSNKHIYIGLSYDVKNRFIQHKISDRYNDLVNRFGEESIIFKQLSDYIPAKEASDLEISYIEQYREKGYFILNIAKGGCIGGPKQGKWNEETIRESAKKYLTWTDWNKNDPGALVASQKMGIYHDVTKHMINKRNPRWTIKSIKESASKYKTYSEWRKNAGGGVINAAVRLGIYDQVTSHMPKAKKINIINKDNNKQITGGTPV